MKRSASQREIFPGLGNVDGRSIIISQLNELQDRAARGRFGTHDVNFLQRILRRVQRGSNVETPQASPGSSLADLQHSEQGGSRGADRAQSGPSSLVGSMAGFRGERDGSSKRVSWKGLDFPRQLLSSWKGKGGPETPSLRRRRVGADVTADVLAQMSRGAKNTPIAPARDQPPQLGSVHLNFSYQLTRNKRKIVERDPKGRVKEKHITRFNEGSLTRWLWLRTFEGTIFARPSSPHIWVQLFTLVLIAFITAVITYLCMRWVDSPVTWVDYDRHDMAEVFEVLDEFQVVASTSETVTTLVAFVLGLYVSKSVDIWWNLRFDQLQTVLNTIDSLSMRMAVYFPGQGDSDMEAKATVLRYGALSVKLLFKDCREVDAWTLEHRLVSRCDDLHELEQEGLLLPHETNLLVDCPCKSQVVWVWIASYMTKLCLDGRLPNPLANQESVLEECIEARNSIANILARVNTQFPLSYTHLVVFMVKLLLYVHSIIAGYIFALSFFTSYWYQAAVQLAYLVIWSIFHMGLINIREHIANPFRDNPCDFSSAMLTARSLNHSKAFFEAGTHPPYTYDKEGNGTHRAAALPPQLIVRQLYGGRMKPRAPHTPDPHTPRREGEASGPQQTPPRAHASAPGVDGEVDNSRRTA